MEASLIVIVVFVTILAALGTLAIALGADSRDGFGNFSVYSE